MLAIVAILIYLWFRFEWQFALGAMIANVHDLVLTIGFMSVTQIDFDLTSIAALLTILGYSLNDTIVIYDRIREMLRRYKRLTHGGPAQHLGQRHAVALDHHPRHGDAGAARAADSSAATAIHSFTATMMFGVVLVGTYTSVFIAAPILIYLARRRTGRDAHKDEALTVAAGGDAPHLPRARADRGLRQRRLPLRRHVASRLAVVPAERCLGLAGGVSQRHHRAIAGAGFRRAPSEIGLFLLGAGNDRWIMPDALFDRFRALKINVEASRTGTAVSTYNILLERRPPRRRGLHRGGLRIGRYVADMADAFDHCGERCCAKATGIAFSRRFSRHPNTAARCTRFTPSIWKSRARASSPASRCRAEIRLQWWRDVLGGIGRGDIDAHPVAAAIAQHRGARSVAAAGADHADRCPLVRSLRRADGERRRIWSAMRGRPRRC